MKNIIFLVVALLLISFGIFLGVGIRTKASIVEKPQELALTEKTS